MLLCICIPASHHFVCTHLNVCALQDKYHDKRWYVLPSVALAEKEKKDETKIAPPSAPPPPTPDLKKETEKKDSPPEKRPPPPPAVDLRELF